MTSLGGRSTRVEKQFIYVNMAIGTIVFGGDCFQVSVAIIITFASHPFSKKHSYLHSSPVR